MICVYIKEKYITLVVYVENVLIFLNVLKKKMNNTICPIFEGIIIEIIYSIEPNITIRKLMRNTGYSYLTVTHRLEGLRRIKLIKTKYVDRKKTFTLTPEGQNIRDLFEEINQTLMKIQKELKDEYVVLLDKIL